ncbi:MAG: hypothetical protein SXV54_24845 [Chloroflexota bacterium]|nr:hypothetical protein [Chloroflexota bacterium]
MNRKVYQISLVVLLVLLSLGTVMAVAQGADSPASTNLRVPNSAHLGSYPIAARTQLTPTDFITVTSTSDDGGMSERCDTVTPCTLRRAINQVRWHSAPGRVFRIAFDIETSDPGYDVDKDVWIIEVDSDNTSETFAFREFGTYGQVIVDGTTQPIGRDLSVGPRIILRGDNRKGAFNLTGGSNVVRGIAFQGFGDNMVQIPATNDNLIEENWFGLTITGTGIYLRNPLYPEDGSGEGGIYAQASGSDGTTNTIQSNVLVGFKASAINVQGDHNYILSNTVGTYADGTVPEVREERKCKPNARYYNWFAGAGVKIFGADNLVAYNRIVGMLFQSNDPLNTPDDALSVTGWDHVIRHNTIGVASDGTPFGVCGDGIHVGGASGGHFVQVISNTIVGAHGTAGILVTGGELGYDLDAVTVQGNVIEDSVNEAFKFGDKLPAELRGFNPAEITSISGLDVTGTSGENSLCENCVIEVFLDRLDWVTETLEPLGKTVADGSGNWSFALTRTLALTEGLRTASTTVVDEQIPHPSPPYSYHAGTTTRISTIYTQTGAPAPEEPPVLVPPVPLDTVEPEYMPAPTPPPTYNLVITVTTTADPDDSEQYVCYNAGYPGVVGKTNRLPCTLRQAIEEAESVMAADPSVRPVQIIFDLDASGPGYDPSGFWVIQITDTLNLNALPTLGSTDVNKSGKVVIDGDTQPGGRTGAPKIVLRGPANTEPNGNALVINGYNNVIRNIAFQDFRMVLQLNHGQNIVENNWFGLTTDGTGIYLRKEEAPEDGSGQSGIKAASAATNTLIQNNVAAGYRGAAIDVEGSDSYILNNTVGTRADGTVPEATWNRWCRPNARYHNWFGGAGVEIGGKRNQVIGNRIAGLLWYSADPTNTPDDALSVTGQDHLVQENIIGVDSNDDEVGSCGRGLVVDARYTRVLSNTVVRAAAEPFRINGSEKTMNALYYQGNLSWDSDPAYLRWGNYIPEARSIFTPAQVLTIEVAGGSTIITGSNHPEAPCPYCQVELFLDDLDEMTETLESLAITQADVNGDWDVTLNGRELALTEGIRTASTILNYGVIEQFDFPSTSRVSHDVYSRTGAILPTPPPDPDPVVPPAIPEIVYLDPPDPPASYNTVITVTTTDDSNTSSSQTCGDVAADACSLRLAINGVEHLTATLRPALIAFDIPGSDPGYVDVGGGYWVITLTADLPPVKGGQVTIDGSTQDGRTTGPTVIVRRRTTTGDMIQLGETQYEGGCVLQGLALQGVEVHMNGDDNIIAHNWLGMEDDGAAIYIYDDDPSRQNHAIIWGLAESDHNHIHHNVVAGPGSEAIKFQGYDSLVEHNYIGTLADGTIPVETIPVEEICDHTLLSGGWHGGGGITFNGKRHQIISNTLAGLMQYGSAQQTQPPAIELKSGQDHLVQYNRIGVDAAGTEVWTCGPAIDNTDASYARILSNTIVNAYQQGIFVDGTVIAINATTMQGNVISNSVTAIEFGESVPEALSLFGPALVTRIEGTNVTGISDDPCPYCYVDVFMDDDDPTTEALVYLGTTAADVNGDWSFVLPAELEDDQGLRTISTARNYGVMQYFEAGTSSGLSMLFQPQPLTAPGSVNIDGPSETTLEPGQSYNFSASVSPVSATLPITYTWEASDHAPQTVSGGVTNDINYSWALTGTKYITVTVDNGIGSPVAGYYSVQVQSEVSYDVYLPLILRES